jgi:hypothetical protein
VGAHRPAAGGGRTPVGRASGRFAAARSEHHGVCARALARARPIIEEALSALGHSDLPSQHLAALKKANRKSETDAPPAVVTTAGASSTSGAADTPKVLISYAYEGSEVEDWVVGLASRLRGDGIETLLDRWAVRPGYYLTYFMESAIRESNNVRIVCTPTYTKADERGRRRRV